MREKQQASEYNNTDDDTDTLMLTGHKGSEITLTQNEHEQISSHYETCENNVPEVMST